MSQNQLFYYSYNQLKTILSSIRFFILVPIFLSLTISGIAQTCAHNHHHHEDAKIAPLKFVENQNQWHDNVEYMVEMGGLNLLYLESNAMTWYFRDNSVTTFLHDNPDFKDPIDMDAHAYKMRFLGSGQPILTGFQKQTLYHNYFLGNDSKKWAGKVPIYEGVLYDELYPGVQMKAYSQQGNFKYDFIIQPKTDPSIIQMEYEGTDDMTLNNGNLYIKTSLEDMVEQKPYAYQIIDSMLVEVVCNYKLSNNTISFDLPNGYNKSAPLIIDPVVIAATRSGSTSDNWGFSATYDNIGNIYAGGISFNTGYPTTVGAFQLAFAGGFRDIAITKYNPDGSEQIYATYIGGSQSENPHSMIVDFNGQLCIYGTSASPNYPTTPNAVQTTIGGDIDIIITKLNADGSALVGSTFLGGNEDDGTNTISPSGQSYDDNRGEIVLDAQGNIYIASCSDSNNFPTTQNAFQAQHNGNQDGVVCKLNSDLSTLFWSTYLGALRNDTAMGLRIDKSGRVVVVGTTLDENFIVGGGGYQSTWPGGNNNLFVVKLSPNGQTLDQGTFFGSTDGSDYGYFLDIDEDGNVHVYGQTTGTIDVTPNTYFSFEGSRQFLAGLSPNLNSLVYSTVIGNGTGFGFDFVPVAFMVDKCNGIYFSAFQADSGLPVTSDAIDVGDDYFYLAKLSPNAETLDYATYYGNAFHVDGGTSRFDKAGIVYQAVCSCDPDFGSSSIMNTLPNAYSSVNSPNCSIGVFKIDFEIETVTAAAFASPSTSGCAPLTIDFKYTGSDAETFFWDFGTNDTSTEENPVYTFEDAGTYSVMQIVNAPNTCNATDTFFLQIDVLDNNSSVTDTAFCPGTVNLFLDVSTANATYNWQDGSNGATYSVSEIGTYHVDVDIGTCIRRDSFIVTTASEINIELGTDQTHCDVNSIPIDATDPNGAAYLWNTGAITPVLNVTNSGSYAVTIVDPGGCTYTDEVEITIGVTPDIQLGVDTTLCDGESLLLAPSISGGVLTWQDGSSASTLDVTTSGTYWLAADDEGCVGRDSLVVVFDPLPIVDFETQDVDCNGNSNGFIEPFFPQSVSDFDFIWSNGSLDIGLVDLVAGNYEVSITDANSCVYATTVEINEPAPFDLIIEARDVQCFGDGNGSISLEATVGGSEPYLYSFDNGTEFTNNPILDSLNGGWYDIVLQDANNCSVSQQVFIYEPPAITLVAGEDKIIELGDSVRINGFISPDFGQAVTWESTEYVSCETCLRPFAKPVNTANYILSYRDTTTGCTHTDSLIVFVEKPRNVYIPNVFSPDGDGFNDRFYPFGDQSVERVNYMKIFDRWGEFVYEAYDFDVNDPSIGWDGVFRGEKMQPAVFVYVMEMVFKDGVVKVYEGDFAIVK